VEVEVCEFVRGLRWRAGELKEIDEIFCSLKEIVLRFAG
jgi:hypothetical protein